MNDPIGAKLDTADLERFLESFRRALQMQRKAFFNCVFRWQFPLECTLPYPNADIENALDLRSWLDVQPSMVIVKNKAYERLIGTQQRLLNAAQVAQDAVASGNLSPPVYAASLHQSQLLWHQAERLIAGVTSSMTDVDELTGLLNRRAMERDLVAAIEQVSLGGQLFSIAMVDADHFKRVNDDLGHGFGDLVLETLAARFEEALRSRDNVYRYGGEEFLVLMPDTDGAKAIQVVERLRIEAGGTGISDGAHSIRITVSAGVTEVSAVDDMASALERADKALYRAKDSGRNRVVQL